MPREKRRVPSFDSDDKLVAERAADREKETGRKYKLVILSACECDVQPRPNCPYVHQRRMIKSKIHGQTLTTDESSRSNHSIREDCDYDYVRKLFLEKVTGKQDKSGSSSSPKSDESKSDDSQK